NTVVPSFPAEKRPSKPFSFVRFLISRLSLPSNIISLSVADSLLPPLSPPSATVPTQKNLLLPPFPLGPAIQLRDYTPQSSQSRIPEFPMEAAAASAPFSNTYYYIPPLAFLSRVSISLHPASRRHQQQRHQFFRRSSSSSIPFSRGRSCCFASSPEALVSAANSAPGRGVANKRGGGDGEEKDECGDLKSWMHQNGLPPCKVVLRDRPSLDEKLCSIHYVAASEDLQAGDVAFSVPNSLVVTLDRVLGNETVGKPFVSVPF
ncbi:unnamed protein product, partial [Linum tenue]